MDRIGLSVAEAAATSSVGKSTLRRAIASGDLPVWRVGSRVVIPPDALTEWLARTSSGAGGTE